MTKINTIAVYCGSSLGKNEVYREMAITLAEAMCQQKIDLVYGGGNIGLMGVIASSMQQNSGKVIGVLPHFLNKKEVGNLDIEQLILVNSMHERKQKISELADAFIAMPGGFGTLEEITEMLTWSQLGLSLKPVGLYNVNGFYDLLLHQFDLMVSEGFLKADNRNLLVADADPNKLLTKLHKFKYALTPKWLQSDQT